MDERLGTEMRLDLGNYLKDVVSFYKGNWKKGKKMERDIGVIITH